MVGLLAVSRAATVGHFASLGRGAFDPVLSDRCSPSQFLGPKKYTNLPRKIPEVNAIVVSVSSLFLDSTVANDVLSVILTTSMRCSLQLRLLLDTLLKRTRPPDPLDSEAKTISSR